MVNFLTNKCFWLSNIPLKDSLNRDACTPQCVREGDELVVQSLKYVILTEDTTVTLNCTLQNSLYPWMSWYVQDSHGQFHFLATIREKGGKEKPAWRGTSYLIERVSETVLRLVVTNVTESQILFCTCSKGHSDKQTKKPVTNSASYFLDQHNYPPDGKRRVRDRLGDGDMLVEQSLKYAIMRKDTILTVTCTLKDTSYPWMSWYVKDLHGQLHFLATTGIKDDKATARWQTSSYSLERVTEKKLVLVVANVTNSQVLYCTCSQSHSDKKDQGNCHKFYAFTFFSWISAAVFRTPRNRITPMGSRLLVILLFSSGRAVIQFPSVLVTKGQPVTLNCSQEKINYDNMYWYKQEWRKDAPLQLVIFSIKNVEGDVEKPFKGRFVSSGITNNALSISVANAQPDDSGTYYCAEQDYTVRQRMRKPHTNLLMGTSDDTR
uniref:Uncharacterized protein n=1 Tax=Sphaerodactylus townsendi TaxID=933632 RepID=A0ACB8ES22_9SAUR